MMTYNWDLIERLLHEVQNGAGKPFAPRIHAEELAHYEQRLAAWQAASCATASTGEAQTVDRPHLADDPPHPLVRGQRAGRYRPGRSTADLMRKNT